MFRVIIVIGLNNNQDIVHFLNSSSCSWWPFRVYMLLLHSTMMRWPRAIEFYFSFPCVAIILNSRFNNFWWKWNMKHTHTHKYIYMIPLFQDTCLPSGNFSANEKIVSYDVKVQYRSLRVSSNTSIEMIFHTKYAIG